MGDNKGIVPVIASCLIVAAVFLVIAFVAPFERGDTFWIAFVFVCVAIVVTFAANLAVVVTGRSLKSALYRASIPAVSIGYLIVASIVSLVFMAMAGFPSWVLIVVQVVLLALCLLSLVGGVAGAALVEQDEAATQAQISAISTLRMQANNVLPFANDEQTRKALTDLNDRLRYTDPVSNSATAAVDQQLLACMAQINEAFQVADSRQVPEICGRMMLYIEQREAVCRASK